MGSVIEPGQPVKEDHTLVLEDLEVEKAVAVREHDCPGVGTTDNRERGGGRGGIDAQERHDAVDVSLELCRSVTELGSDLLG
jgi:hypothetical protein